MTTAKTTGVRKTTDAPGRYRLPDTGHAHHLAQRLGNPETTLVTATDYWIAPHPHADRRQLRRPDLLVAFGVDPARYVASNGYIISEQGKPPDSVLEIASASTTPVDTGTKRIEYAALSILEYWRFDETGEHHGTELAGDTLPGHSVALNLHLRWVRGQLG